MIPMNMTFSTIMRYKVLHNFSHVSNISEYVIAADHPPCRRFGSFCDVIKKKFIPPLLEKCSFAEKIKIISRKK
jgi:hypothetical protein